MLWNWNTIDSCFLAESWRTQTSGAFAGSCIGVILLVILLELLRRAGKEIDAWVVNAHRKKLSRRSARNALSRADASATKEAAVSHVSPTRSASSRSTQAPGRSQVVGVSSMAFRPTPLQQAVRATHHMATFALAYIIML